MYKIGIMGDRVSVLGFKSLGIDIFPTDNQDTEETRSLLHSLAKKDYAIIYVMENLAIELADEISKYDEVRLPAIIPLPNKSGPLGIGMRSVKKAVEKAVGADILFGGEKNESR